MNIKNIIINILTITILTTTSHIAKCQVFDNSQAHFNVKWMQIDRENFRLIFPEEFKDEAPALAHKIDHYLQISSQRLKVKPRKISIILQQHHVNQNGFVQLAPRKSELFSTPSAIADNQEWLPNLALHEMQHVIQFDKLTGKIHQPFGELLALAFFGIHLPSWFYEGDAVLQETLYSQGGRGRLSSWNMELRANILEGKEYDFNKYVHGSYKDITPTYYTIGYFMNSMLYEKNPEIHLEIYEDMRKNLLRPFNFQRALKKHHGAKASVLFAETIDHLKEKWTPEEATNTAPPLTFDDKYPTHYLLPQRVGEYMYAIQRNNQRPQRIVKFHTLNPQKVEHIIYTGVQLMPYFHIHNNLIVWDEYRKDSRFSKQTYNIINIYDCKTKTKKTLTLTSRLYTPVVSPDATQIACVKVGLDNKSALTFLDINSGIELDSIVMPDDIHIQQPYFNEEGTKLVCIGVRGKGTTLLEIDRYNKTITPLMEWSNLQLERPSYASHDIVFKVNQKGKDEIFVLRDGNIYPLTQSRYGAFHPTSDSTVVWFSEYTSQGFKINKISMADLSKNATTLTKAETLFDRQNSFSAAEQTFTPDSLDNAIKPYRTLPHSINFHSLTISANDFESFDNYKPGIYWLSNDVLNTTRIKVGYEREIELAKNTFLGEITFQKYYPKFTVGYKNTGKFGWAQVPNNKDSIRFDYREHQLTAEIQLPLSVYRGHRVYSFGFNFGTYYIKRYDVSINLTRFMDKIKFPLSYQLYFNRNWMMAPMDLAPRWGQNFNLTFRHLPFMEGDHISWALRTSFYFPGLMLNHSLQARFGLQEAKGNFSYNYDIPLPDGFSYLPRNLVKNTLLFDYRLPLFYPDLSIGQLAYVKRIHTQLSADYLNVHESSFAPKSLSAYLNFDFNLFKYNEPLFTLSLKGTYINDSRVKEKFIPAFSLSYNY